jgi:hypothetical protein
MHDAIIQIMADELAYEDGDLCNVDEPSHTLVLDSSTNHWRSVCASDGILGKSVSKWRR